MTAEKKQARKVGRPSVNNGKRIRMSLTLDPETDRILREFGKANEMSTATALRKFLVELSPSIQQITEALNKAKELPTEAIEDMHGLLLNAQNDLNQQHLDFHEKTKARKKPK